MEIVIGTQVRSAGVNRKLAYSYQGFAKKRPDDKPVFCFVKGYPQPDKRIIKYVKSYPHRIFTQCLCRF